MSTTREISATAHPRLALAVSCSAFFLSTIDILIVNIALPAMGEELGGRTSALQWVIDGYTLVFAALLLCAGNLADRFGAKRAIGIGIMAFLLTSLLCALAPTIELLVVFRAGQGAAAALILPASMSLIRETFPDPTRRAHALGIWSAGGAVAGAAGPLLGGMLIMIDWRLVFAINVPVCVAMLMMLPKIGHSPRHGRPFDWAGQVLAIIALGGLVYGLIEGGVRGFTDLWVVTALLLSAAAIGSFIAVQARVAHPMMPLDLFRSAELRIGLLGGFAHISVWFGTVFLISLFLQQELGLSPLKTGMAFFPAALASLFGNLGSGPTIARFGRRAPVIAGMACTATGLVTMAATLPLQQPWLIASLVAMIGFGGSVAMPALTGLVLAGVDPNQAGIASAVLNTFRQVGGAVSIAVLGVLATTADTFLDGVRLAFLLVPIVSVLALLAGLRIRPR